MEDPSNPFAGINWFVSVIGAIVLSILANLLTSPVQNRLGKLNAKRSAKRVEQLKNQLAQIDSYVSSPQKLQLYLIGIGLKIAFITLVAFALGDLISASITASSRLSRIYFPDLFYAASQFMTSLFYVIGINYVLAGMRTVKQVTTFPQYEAEVKNIITTLDSLKSATSIENTAIAKPETGLTSETRKVQDSVSQ